MIKVMLVFGTRPEAIKMCPLVRELEQQKDMETVVCVTGQHKEMLRQVLDVFCIYPKYNLEIMRANQTLTGITAGILTKLEEILEKEKPDVLLVHGDTTTAFAAALAGFYLKIPIGHIEAGLRTYDFQSPFPEEFNRRAVDLISTYDFAPTENAKCNLTKEGKSPEHIYVTGNTGIDALKTTVQKEYTHRELVWAAEHKLVLVTAHRRENIGESMQNMFRAIKNVVMEHPDVKVVYPVHFNPKVRKIAAEILEGTRNIHLIEPLDVIDFHNFMDRSYLVLTDSGGIQEEAPALGKPVLVLRDTTERPEGVEAGTLKVIGTSEESIYSNFKRLLEDKEEYRSMSQASNPYGDGKASERIVEILRKVVKE